MEIKFKISRVTDQLSFNEGNKKGDIESELGRDKERRSFGEGGGEAHTVAKIHRNRMTFRRFGSLQSWRELCPFLSTSRCDRNTIEPSKLFVSCEPLRIIIEEKPNSETRIDVCTYLLITSFSVFSLTIFATCIAHFVIQLKDLYIYIYWIIEFVCYCSYCLSVISDYVVDTVRWSNERLDNYVIQAVWIFCDM